LAIAAWIVAVMNNGVPHVIGLLGVMTVVMDVVLPWKGMRRTVHFIVRRRQAIFNRYTHESILRKLLGNVCLHEAAAVATWMNRDRYAMSSAVVDVVHGRSNVHAIYDLVGLNYAGWRRWGLRFRQIDNPYQGYKKNGMFHFYPFQLTLFSSLSININVAHGKWRLRRMT
jgi:hypothetical protein